MRANSPVEKVTTCIASSGAFGVSFHDVVSKTGLCPQQTETLLSSLKRDKKIKLMYHRWFLFSKRLDDGLGLDDKEILKRRKKILQKNIKFLGDAIEHRKAALTLLEKQHEELVAELEIDKLQIPPRLKRTGLSGGPRRTLWSESERESYRDGLEKNDQLG